MFVVSQHRAWIMKSTEQQINATQAQKGVLFLKANFDTAFFSQSGGGGILP